MNKALAPRRLRGTMVFVKRITCRNCDFLLRIKRSVEMDATTAALLASARSVAFQVTQLLQVRFRTIRNTCLIEQPMMYVIFVPKKGVARRHRSVWRRQRRSSGTSQI
jgi:hypothetical protein